MRFAVKEGWLTEYVGEEKYVVLPQNVGIVAAGALEGAAHLERVEFSESVKKAGAHAFARCVNLKEVVLNPSGNEARLAGRAYEWREAQTLYWQGVSYPRRSEEYRQLIARLYDAVYAQDEAFRADLAQIRGREITHRLGRNEIERTILTRAEFEWQLTRLAE